MENNEKNGKVVSAQAAEAEKENGAEMTAGKFRDVRSLQQAYESLQAEFTKKCQQVKSLVGELSKKDKERMIAEYTKQMKEAARLLEFEYAALMRDKIAKLQNEK